jgi:hypothetical protein
MAWRDQARYRHASRRFEERRASSSGLSPGNGWSSLGSRDRDSRELSPSRSRTAEVPRRSCASTLPHAPPHSTEIRNLSGVQAGLKPQSIGIDGGIPKIRSDSRYCTLCGAPHKSHFIFSGDGLFAMRPAGRDEVQAFGGLLTSTNRRLRATMIASDCLSRPRFPRRPDAGAVPIRSSGHGARALR